MFWHIGNPKSINDLKDLNLPPKGQSRSAIPIAVVDDEQFPYIDNLRRHDFNLKELGDISDIKAVMPYPIVLCDIKGVGKAFASKYEGGHVIEEIRRYYPSKVLIAYTAHRFDPSFNKFFQMCDYSLNKDADSDQWVDCLAEAVKIASDFVKQWVKVREGLMRMEVPAMDIVLLEDEYVRRVLGETSVFPTPKLIARLGDNARQVVIGFVSSFLANILSK